MPLQSYAASLHYLIKLHGNIDVMIFFFNTVFSSFVQHTLEVLDKDFEDVPGFDNFKAEGKTASCLVSNI